MRFRTPSIFLAAALAVAVTTVPTTAKAPFARIVVFGTSLSDSGNAFALRGATNTPPDYQLDPLLVPGAPYARGGLHFSNGATWVEQLARSLGLAPSVRPAFASSSPEATNYAVGSARAYNDGKNVNFGDQEQEFLADVGGAAPPDALYVIEMGSNDIRDAIVAFQTGGFPAAQVVLQQALASIAQNVQVLYGAGAREFLVWVPPNVALTPAIRQLERDSPGAAQLATALTQAFNGGLNGVLTQLSALPDINIRRLNAYALLNGIVADPQTYDLNNVTEACVTPNVAPFACDRPDEYLFWDGIHPTDAGHAILASTAALLLGQ
jgi:phospholipase/lecithinase/hemolysin